MRGRDHRAARWAAVLVLVATACSGASDGAPSSVPTTPANEAPATSTQQQAIDIYPDGWDDIELTASVSQAQPGDTVDVSIVCPHRGQTYLAWFEAVHPDLSFAVQEVPPTADDRYDTSFVVPYWLEPGELALLGGCPRPPGPCDDDGDCHEFDSDRTPVVTLPTVAPAEQAWDVWRPLDGPRFDPTGDVGTTLPGGAVVAQSDAGGMLVDAALGDRIQVAAQCALDAPVEGARFVVVPLLAIDRANEHGSDWEWEIAADPELPGRYTLFSESIGQYVEVLDEPIPWLFETPSQSVSQGDTAVTISAEIVLDPELISGPSGPNFVLHVTALCSDVGAPFDPRSINLESAVLPALIRLFG